MGPSLNLDRRGGLGDEDVGVRVGVGDAGRSDADGDAAGGDAGRGAGEDGGWDALEAGRAGGGAAVLGPNTFFQLFLTPLVKPVAAFDTVEGSLDIVEGSLDIEGGSFGSDMRPNNFLERFLRPSL